MSSFLQVQPVVVGMGSCFSGPVRFFVFCEVRCLQTACVRQGFFFFFFFSQQQQQQVLERRGDT